MQNRRAFLTTSTLALMAGTLPGFAQHSDLQPEPGSDDQPVRRRYLMEDTYGNVVTDESLQGRFVLIYFGYMSCPDVCPTSLSTIADVLEQLGQQADGLTVLFVTVDPKRDTAKNLREYIHFFDKRIIGLRGPKAYTDHMVKTFNARYEFHYPDPADPAEYSVDHTASIAFVGPDGHLIRRFPHGMPADEITADISATITSARIE
ncbi:SCO family protein [Alisedimentitalea sp. MJ-SS2]|uniref:SCO family protein n=1 Tax=Aliisedimentitalea sp. MJ-SS2 TaxID=3049795 RepID=UPI00290F9468|nr:SCO family protein [Alisedimentitalea sp. MJ-SS2]MDU8927196.1 SCO family protein [Alisedimentitalea sp. MJ-SS2]